MLREARIIECARWCHSVTFAALLAFVSLGCQAQTTVTLPDTPFGTYDAAADRALDRVLKDAQSQLHEPDADVLSQSVAAATVPAFQPSGLAAYSVGDYAARYWNGRVDDLRSALLRLAKIRPALEEILAQEGVPSQFAAVVLVESGANPVAISPKAARGLWQFLTGTATQYGLVVSVVRDDRIDLDRSTRAAARYLRELYQEFGEWRLALAAYNAGANSLRQAIERARSSDFATLSDEKLIPAETRNYVPAVLSAVNLLETNR